MLLGKDEIYDSSDLDNVENVKGSETYSMNGDNMRVWTRRATIFTAKGISTRNCP